MSGVVKNVAIIGAGLGGLATAIALRKQGIDVRVYEKAKQFLPAGAGLGLFPNGLKFLEAIDPDLVKAVYNSGCPLSKVIVKNIDGATIKSNPTDKIKEKYGHTIVTVWWSRLQQILASFLPDNIINLNYRCVGFKQNNEEVEIYFENGKTAKADLLIGADGINSAVRKHLIGDVEPRYLNTMSWRAVIKSKNELINPHEIVRIVSDRQFIFLINVGDNYLCWTTRKFAPECNLSANNNEMKSRILKDLENWAEPIRKLIEITEAEKIFEAPLFDRLPLTSWSKNRVTLLGDAAHPMSPSGGQGANSAFEDAWVLAQCLSRASNLENALNMYEKERIDRTTKIQNFSFQGEQNQWKTDNQPKPKQQKNPDNNFSDWLYNYQPFTNLITS